MRNTKERTRTHARTYTERAHTPAAPQTQAPTSLAVLENAIAQSQSVLTSRWTPLRPHAEQQAYLHSKRRFNIVPATRRGGKTEIGKRRMVLKACSNNRFPDMRYAMTAPTQEQATNIFWEDLKRFVPDSLLAAKPHETHHFVRLINGATIFVAGLDKPERIEGPSLDGILMDEYANMKKSVWTEHVRPALSTIGRPGEADFIGVPEGRNHYYDLFEFASADTTGQWGVFTWTCEGLLDPEEIEAARGDMDELTFQQEYYASFINFSGRAYYTFQMHIHAKEKLEYNPSLPLIICFDFNTAPGTAVICQEQNYKGKNPNVAKRITAVLGEVWIPRGSNTKSVCDRLISDWDDHEGQVYLYGDATGGAEGSAKVSGSDWDLITRAFRPVFKGGVYIRVPKANPPERARINSLNSRIEAADKTIRLLVDPRCKHTIQDLEGVQLLEGGSGEIDKRKAPMLSHLSDALGYYVHYQFPMSGGHNVRTTAAW